jgi:predicted ATP-dependent endonuclease of OLD family
MFDFKQNPQPREITTDSIDEQIHAACERKSGIKCGIFLDENNLSLQGKIVQNIIKSIKSIEAIRESRKQTPMEFKREMGERGSNLIGLMHTLFNNDNRRFRQIEEVCKKIFPDIIEIHPDLLQENQIRILVKKRLLQNEIDLAQEGSGIDQLFIIIWSIATAEKDTIWFLDEPELHLHPGAQKLLYDFFHEESENGKQIFVATHSMIFIHNSKPEEIYMLVDKGGKTQLIRMSDLIPPEQINSAESINKIRTEVYKVLGYKPIFSFEPNTVVFVEGSTDEGILKAFAKKLLDKEIDENTTRFIITGSSKTIESFGPLFVYALLGKKVILFRDNDKENPADIKEEMLRLEGQYRTQARIGTPILSDDNFYFFPEYVSM